MRVAKDIREQFYEVLKKKKVHPVYQPIFSLSDGSVYGYEALSRIDLNGCGFNTEQMFEIAEKLKCLWELETVCHKLSIKYPAASNGVSILQRCRAAGYLTLAAFANCPCKHGRLAHCSQE